jgi:hypothetical protein
MRGFSSAHSNLSGGLPACGSAGRRYRRGRAAPTRRSGSARRSIGGRSTLHGASSATVRLPMVNPRDIGTFHREPNEILARVTRLEGVDGSKVRATSGRKILSSPARSATIVLSCPTVSTMIRPPHRAPSFFSHILKQVFPVAYHTDWNLSRKNPPCRPTPLTEGIATGIHCSRFGAAFNRAVISKAIAEAHPRPRPSSRESACRRPDLSRANEALDTPTRTAESSPRENAGRPSHHTDWSWTVMT